MSREHIVNIYYAPARSGKSCYWVAKIVDEILPESKSKIYCNLPLNIDKIAEYCKTKYNLDPLETIDRLHIIPRETELLWRRSSKGRKIKLTADSPEWNETLEQLPYYEKTDALERGYAYAPAPLTGPWEYFQKYDLENAYVVIDEIHNFCGSIGTIKQCANAWAEWLGELGHHHGSFHCISQSKAKIHTVIKTDTSAEYEISNTGFNLDPFFKIPMYDWYELIGGMFNRPYKVFVFCQESLKAEGNKKNEGRRKLFLMGQPYFTLYDSFNKPISQEGEHKEIKYQYEYARHLKKGFFLGRLSLFFWFLGRNFTHLTPRFFKAVGIVAVLLFIGGAFPWSMGDAMSWFSLSTENAAKSTSAAASASPANAQTPGAPAQPVALRPEDMPLDIAVITPDTLTLRSGLVLKVGDKILIKCKHQGKTITAINWENKYAQLDDSSLVLFYDNELERLQLEQSAADGNGKTNHPGTLRRPGEVGLRSQKPAQNSYQQ